MRITIFTIGTRGDVQPYAVLGKALANRGHDVTLSTAKNFGELVKKYQLKFHPVDVDFEEILISQEGEKIMKGNPFTIQKSLNKLLFPIVERSLNKFYQLAQTSDLIIYRPKTLADVFLKEVNTKAIMAAVVPAMEETAAFINPNFSGFKLPCFMNRWSYKLNQFRYRVFKKPISSFQLKNGLEENIPVHPNEIPCIYGISPHFLERPEDWSENHLLTGFWLSSNKAKLNPDLLSFLKAGSPPILITFGSMPIKKEIALMILKAISNIKERFLIVAGWANWDIELPDFHDSSTVKIVESVPYETVCPLVKAVVHHGGIGTTAECLRAGKPMFPCPVIYPMGDQSFWAELAYKKGIAVKPVPLSKLTEKVFVQKIRELITDLSLYKNSKALAEQLNAEDGLQKAIDFIESYSQSPDSSAIAVAEPLAS
ncbi:glycosyltransferase [Rubrolithibacter danxiaensis]|uniref:glycosyltransferase n=1 Tax=Rubrolithibacter danxiaensis TaxID=3390805 RepID=UPI003BF86CFD